MGYDLQRLRDLHALPAMTEHLRHMYPKMDKPLLSKAMNDGYGIQLTPAALKSLAQTFDPDGWEKRREKDRHTLKLGVRCRLTEKEFDDFTARYQADGYKSANECVRFLIQRYIRDSLITEELIEEERIEREKQLWRNFTEEEYPV